MTTDLVLDVRPGDEIAFVRTFDPDGVSVRFRFRWFARVGLWFVEMFDPSDNPIALGQFARGSGRILADRRDPRVPPGVLFWTGADPYSREDLGTALLLNYRPAAAEAPVDARDVFRRLGLLP